MVVKLHHGTGSSLWTSNTVTLTPADAFYGDLSLLEVRTDHNGDPEPTCTTLDDCYEHSDLTLNIQPAGSDVIIKYQPEDDSAPIFYGYEDITQSQQLVTDVETNMNYYISIYIAPGFEHTINPDNSVTITCLDSNNDGEPDLPTCQDGDIPSGYGSNMALVSERSPYAQQPLGIEGMGDIFGMPMKASG